MKITRKLLEEMVKEEIDSIREGIPDFSTWDTPRLLSALQRLVGSMGTAQKSEKQLSMSMIDQLIKNEGTGEKIDLSTPPPTGFEE